MKKIQPPAQCMQNRSLSLEPKSFFVSGHKQGYFYCQNQLYWMDVYVVSGISTVSLKCSWKQPCIGLVSSYFLIILTFLK